MVAALLGPRLAARRRVDRVALDALEELLGWADGAQRALWGELAHRAARSGRVERAVLRVTQWEAARHRFASPDASVVAAGAAWSASAHAPRRAAAMEDAARTGSGERRDFPWTDRGARWVSWACKEAARGRLGHRHVAQAAEPEVVAVLERVELGAVLDGTWVQVFELLEGLEGAARQVFATLAGDLGSRTDLRTLRDLAATARCAVAA